jgi:hypothetical protein
MGFKNDFSQANNGNNIKPEGDYECIITAIEEKTTKNGKTKLGVQLVIRNDIEGQKYGNAMLFYDIWKKKEPTQMDMQVGGFGFGQLMALGKAAGLPDGKDYASIKEYCEDLLNKCVIAHMEHEDYNGSTQERVRWLNPTKHPDCKHTFKKAVPTVDTFAKNEQSFAGTSDVMQQLGDMSEFEEILSDDGVPF